MFIGQAKAISPEAGGVTFTSTGAPSGSMWRTGSPCTSTASAQVSATVRVKRSVSGFPGAASMRSGSNPLAVTLTSTTPCAGREGLQATTSRTNAAGRLLANPISTRAAFYVRLDRGGSPMTDLDIQQRDRSVLREGYSPSVRRFEIASIITFAVAMAWLALRIGPRALASPFLAICAFMLGFVAADFVSGFVHWAADTWGTPEWPLIGRFLIRPFREHHVDEKEITRHDFIETNGNNCFISIAPAVAAALLPARGTGWFFLAALTFALALAIFGTNQFHKWAHMDQPPAAVRALQRAGLILAPDHHAIHHRAPYAKYYCITVGWLNEALFRLRFFQTLERVVAALTGLVPREDDIGMRAALVVAAQPPPPLPDLPKLPIELPQVGVRPLPKPD